MRSKPSIVLRATHIILNFTIYECSGSDLFLVLAQKLMEKMLISNYKMGAMSKYEHAQMTNKVNFALLLCHHKNDPFILQVSV